MIQAPGLASTFKEVFAVLDVAGAAVSSLRLQRLPRCSGQRIVTLPGYGFGDEPMLPLRLQLRTLGGDAQGWGCGVNHGRVATLLPKATARVADIAHEAPVTLVGWSLGGFIAREIAREHPHLIKRVITLGTPVRGGPRYTILRGVYERLGYDLDRTDEEIRAREQARPLEVPVTAIYSKRDGIVAWRACIDEVEQVTEHVAVKATHVGLCYAPAVLEIIAARLAHDAEQDVGATAPATNAESEPSS